MTAPSNLEHGNEAEGDVPRGRRRSARPWDQKIGQDESD